MDSDDFTDRLHELTAEDIDVLAAALRAELETADGEIAWWRATIELTGALRRYRCTRQASLAAHRAASAVLDAARAAGIDDDAHRTDVTAVARAAAEVARVQVLRTFAEEPAAVTADPLLHPWQTVAVAA